MNRRFLLLCTLFLGANAYGDTTFFNQSWVSPLLTSTNITVTLNVSITLDREGYPSSNPQSVTAKDANANILFHISATPSSSSGTADFHYQVHYTVGSQTGFYSTDHPASNLTISDGQVIQFYVDWYDRSSFFENYPYGHVVSTTPTISITYKQDRDQLTITNYQASTDGGANWTTVAANTWKTVPYAVRPGTVTNAVPIPAGAWQYSIDGITYNNLNLAAGVAIGNLGQSIVRFRGTDALGVVQNAQASFGFDNVAPVVTPTNRAGQSFNSRTPGGTPSWTVGASDSHSGIASGQAQIGYAVTLPSGTIDATTFGSLSPVITQALVSGNNSVNIPASGTADGYYYLKATATDNAGNQATAVNGPFILDTTAPVASAPALALTSDGQGLQITWNQATDNLGNMTLASAYSGTYTAGTQTFPLTGAFQTTGSGFQTVLVLDPTWYGQTLSVTITAQDTAGNKTPKTSTFAVPRRLTISAQFNAAASTDLTMETDLTFNLTPQEVKTSFTTLHITRVSGTQTLADLWLDTGSITLNAQGQLLPSANWTSDSSGHLVYQDLIPTSSGAGHRVWTYTLFTTPSQGGTGFTSTATLPNHQGTVSLQVQDTGGHDSTSPDFQIFSDGKVQVALAGTDPDHETWTQEVDRVGQLGTGPVLTSYRSLTGAAATYDPQTGTVLVPLTLALGVNNICLTWQEGGDGAAVFHSSIVSINFVKNSSGGYSITVSDGYSNPAGADANGIVTNPGQPLVFQVNGANPSDFQWDFGDGSAVVNGTSITHAYHQAPGQTTDSTAYTLTLTLPDTTTLTLGITVLDTQEGTLYENETWNGDHTVVGTVVVPTGLTLSIASGTVSFEGGLGGGFAQGLTIQGTLDIADGVTLAKASGQGPGWGTILVQGTATIGAALVQDADRALAVDAGATATLTGTTLRNNLTGLHVVGANTTHLDGVTITANTVYGIKEDAGGRPVVKNSTISGNLRNYYQWDGGLLNIGAINALPGNSGNTGE